MADLNYINPMSLKPEIGWAPKNALAGMMYHQNEQDFRRAFEQQMRLQDLGEQERRYDFVEKQAGAPLRDLERRVKMESASGQLPFARDLAGSTSELGIAKNRFESKSKYGDEAMKAQLRQYTKGMDDANWEKFTRENQYALSLLENAQSIAQSQGPAAAIGYVQQRKKELEAQGFKFPQHFENPQYWGPLYDATLNSVKHLQDLSKERMKGEYELKGRTISADATKYAADASANARMASGSGGSEKNMNIEQEVTRLRRDIRNALSSGDRNKATTLAKGYISALTDQFMEMNKQYYAAAAMDPGGTLMRRLEAGKGQYIDNQLRQIGFQDVAPQEQQQPQPLKNNSGDWEDLGNGVRRRVIK